MTRARFARNSSFGSRISHARQDFQSPGRGTAHLGHLGGVGRLPLRQPAGGRSLLHRHSPAECHGTAAYRPCPQQQPAGHSGPLRAHARQGCAVAARHRPCRHRHSTDRRAPIGRTADEPPRFGAREIPGRSVDVEGGIRRRHCRAAAPAGRLGRLEPRALHHGRGALTRRHQGVCRALPPGPDL